MAHRIEAFLILGVLACTRAPEPGRPASANPLVVQGVIVEQVDAAPYSYLRLTTDAGEAWVAVPLTALEKGQRVAVKNAAPLKNVDIPGTGRRLDAVSFGTLAPSNPAYRRPTP